jgi:diguanylate cyclase (GGDEF)-like protein
LRQQRGWTQEELALKANCSKKTIENIEAGKPKRRPILEEVADALRVQLEEITEPLRRPAVIELNLNRPFDCDEQEFCRTLCERLSLASEPQLISRPSGSVVLALELPARDGDRLIWAVSGGQLCDLHVEAARLVVATDPLKETAFHEPHLLQGPHPQDVPDQPKKRSLLVVDDEPHVRHTLQLLLRDDFEVQVAESADVAMERFHQGRIDLVLADQKMPGRTGVQLLEWVRQQHPRTVRLLMSGYADLDDAIDAINRGHVYHYFTKPWSNDLLPVLRHAAEKFLLERKRDRLVKKLRRSNRKLRQSIRRERERRAATAVTDPLTGLFNRPAMEGLIHQEIHGQIQYPRPWSLGLIEFEVAHPEQLWTKSDEVVKGLARILSSSVRGVDSVGRWDGAQFLVIAHETSELGATRLAERIRTRFAATPLECDGQVIPITLSIGFAVVEGGVHVDFKSMTAIASAALTHAKTADPNRCEIRRVSQPLPKDG